MEDEDWYLSIDAPDFDGGIYTAVRAFCTDAAAAKARYGPIASWDTSRVTCTCFLFCTRGAFNEDISRWDVSNVKNMNGMFLRAISFDQDLSCWDIRNVQMMIDMFGYASSFNRQLDGAWSTSTA